MRKAMSRRGKSEGPRIGSQLQAEFDFKDPRLVYSAGLTLDGDPGWKGDEMRLIL